MLRFDDLQLFVRAADLGSLSAAARVMDLSAAVASAALKRIERQLGARLLARSTRSLRLTAEGEGFLEYARAALGSLEEGRRLLASSQDCCEGVLQLSAPSDFGRNVLLPWLDEFQQQHPQLTVRLLLGDRIADLFRQLSMSRCVTVRLRTPAWLRCRCCLTTGGCSVQRRIICSVMVSRSRSSNWHTITACCSCWVIASMTAGRWRTASARSA